MQHQSSPQTRRHRPRPPRLPQGTRQLIPLRPEVSLALSLGLLSLLIPQTVWSSPPTIRLFKEYRAFQRGAKKIQAEVRVQRGAPPSFPLLDGLRFAVKESLKRTLPEKTSEELELSPDLPPGKPALLTIHKDKKISFGGAELTPRDIRKSKTLSPEMRLLSFALLNTRLSKSRHYLKKNLYREVLTLDRIEKRYVWAVGDENFVVWMDKEVYRPVRIEVAPGILDESHWTLRLSYSDKGVGKGWFPSRMVVEKEREPVVTYHTIKATLKKK